MVRVSTLVSAAALGAALASLAPAQMRVFNVTGERAASTVVFFDQAPLGLVCIQYGQPVWKAEYDTQLDMLKGKKLRLGKDNWTTFNTDVDLTIAGEKVHAGTYFLGLHCDEKGAFSLLAFDATKAAKKKLMPFAPDSWPKADHTIPLTHGKTDKMSEKMLIEIKSVEDQPTKLEFTLAWGKHKATAKGTFHVGDKKAMDASHKKDKKDKGQ